MAKAATHKMTDREVAIGQIIRGACAKISDALTDQADAKEARNAANDTEQTGRLGIVLEIAELSAIEQWSESEVIWGCQYAADVKGNDDRTAKTLATFCAEMKSVASPKVRDDVPTIHRACTLAWQAETDAIELDKKNAPRPLRKFAKRQYHLILRAINEQRMGQLYLTTPDDVVAWAEANDPDLNPDTVADALAAIVEKLRIMSVNFTHADLTECVSALEPIDAKALRACRARPDITAQLPKPPTTHAKAATKPVEAPRPVVAVTPPPTPLAPVQPAVAPAVTAILPPSADGEGKGAIHDGAFDWMDNMDNSMDNAPQLAAAA